MDAKIRKYRYKLMCSGYAVIAFGLWSIVRVFLMRLTDAPGLREMLGSGEESAEYEAVLFSILAVVLAADLLFRLLVGRSAIRESRGERRGITYLLLAAIYAAVSALSDLSYVVRAFRGGASGSIVAANVVDLTSCIAMAEIAILSFSLRRAVREAAD